MLLILRAANTEDHAVGSGLLGHGSVCFASHGAVLAPFHRSGLRDDRYSGHDLWEPQDATLLPIVPRDNIRPNGNLVQHEWKDKNMKKAEGYKSEEEEEEEEEHEEEANIPSSRLKAAGLNELPFVNWKTSYKAHLAKSAKGIRLPCLGTDSIPDIIRETNPNADEETLHSSVIDKLILSWPSSRHRTSSLPRYGSDCQNKPPLRPSSSATGGMSGGWLMTVKPWCREQHRAQVSYLDRPKQPMWPKCFKAPFLGATPPTVEATGTTAEFLSSQERGECGLAQNLEQDKGNVAMFISSKDSLVMTSSGTPSPSPGLARPFMP
ncbi:hypothetical protein AAL_00320 [Moelleriella libera RCEF 2490]|uniref:Uncharacterized protein n=1 Tax=Moelleriella libera RCEF 2490 TaxID=1081109 RepID=A0A166RN44_9HYPO|nr:hypothetical protein AAL_00320 [Moelleriella libera RCEF 2490]